MTPIKPSTPAPVALKATPEVPDALSPARTAPSTSEPASGKETPPVTRVNGSDSATASTPGSAEKDKGERDRERSEKHKPKRKDHRKDRDRDRADKDTARDGDAEGSSGERKDDAVAAATTTSAPPKLDTTGSPAHGSDAGPVSPRTDSTGIHTPTSRKSSRHPWTLFVRLPNPTNETDLREFFGEAKGGITRVHFPGPLNGRDRKIAYVEFGDEEAMKAGLEKHAEKLNDGIPEVKQSDRDPRDYNTYRGRGRGGHRGRFPHRDFAAAGLVRGGGAPKTNGDT